MLVLSISSSACLPDIHYGNALALKTRDTSTNICTDILPTRPLIRPIDSIHISSTLWITKEAVWVVLAQSVVAALEYFPEAHPAASRCEAPAPYLPGTRRGLPHQKDQLLHPEVLLTALKRAQR